MGFIANLGMQAAGNAVDAGFGMILGSYLDRRQLRQQGKLTAQQMEAQNTKSSDIGIHRGTGAKGGRGFPNR